MTDVEKTVPKVAKKLGKKVVKESTKSDEQLLKDAKQRINRLQVCFYSFNEPSL